MLELVHSHANKEDNMSCHGRICPSETGYPFRYLDIQYYFS